MFETRPIWQPGESWSAGFSRRPRADTARGLRCRTAGTPRHPVGASHDRPGRPQSPRPGWRCRTPRGPDALSRRSPTGDMQGARTQREPQARRCWARRAEGAHRMSRRRRVGAARLGRQLGRQPVRAIRTAHLVDAERDRTIVQAISGPAAIVLTYVGSPGSDNRLARNTRTRSASSRMSTGERRSTLRRVVTNRTNEDTPRRLDR
jgi:hypothetical protein